MNSQALKRHAFSVQKEKQKKKKMKMKMKKKREREGLWDCFSWCGWIGLIVGDERVVRVKMKDKYKTLMRERDVAVFLLGGGCF